MKAAVGQGEVRGCEKGHKPIYSIKNLLRYNYIMNEGYAIIISAVLSVGGMALIQFFNYLQRKNEIEERFYFESYQKRISVYDEAISELNRICEDGKVFEKIISNNDVIYKKLLTDMHRLTILYSRITLFGSPGAVKIIAVLCKASIELDIKLRSPLSDKINNFGSLYKNFLMLIEETVIEFCRQTSRETAAEYIDAKTTHIHKKFLKKPWIGIKKKKK
jgi:hypothetical protein